MEGDVADIRLGISNAEWNIVVNEVCWNSLSLLGPLIFVLFIFFGGSLFQVDIIFHAAATVRFDEAIRLATLTNVRGTREALRLARACKNLR